MRLNLGSGQWPTDSMGEWVDVDLPWYGVKPPHGAYGDAFALPFRAGAFDAAYLGHTLEHFLREDIPRLGAELRRVLEPGAQVVVVGPDMDRACAQRQPDWLLEAIVGAPHDGPGGHKWPPTGAATAEAMRLLGLVGVREMSLVLTERPHWPNASLAAWQCCLTGTSPG